LFGQHLHDESRQKAKIFNLFTRFVAKRICLEKEADVPPIIRERLSEIWGHAEQLCHECGSALGAEAVHGDWGGHWCSKECKHEAMPDVGFQCLECGSDRAERGSCRSRNVPPENGYPPIFVDQWATCADCGKKHYVRTNVAALAVGAYERRIAPASADVPPREPAWKRRRRA
jgi:hypothetical protein